MAYPIDKGIPIPPKAETGKGRLMYPWDEMEVGDSFTPNQQKGGGPALVASASKSRPDKVFEARTVKGVSRIWRTA